MEKLDELFRQNPNLERLMRPDAHELEGLADSIQLLRCTREDDPENDEVNFQLAAALISHSRTSYIEEGVHLMETLVCKRWQSNWTDVAGRNSLMPPTDAPSIARGVAVSRATAPPPSDDDEDDGSLVEVSEESGSENGRSSQRTAEADRPTSKAPTEDSTAEQQTVDNSGTATCDGTHSESPSTVVKEADKDADASKIRPGRIDDLALYHYYLTLGWIKLKKMDKASSCADQMLILAPGNKQGKALKTYIEVAGRQDTAVDAATLAGISVVLAGVATVAGALLRSRQNGSA